MICEIRFLQNVIQTSFLGFSVFMQIHKLSE
jgi:hypothetical protein